METYCSYSSSPKKPISYNPISCKKFETNPLKTVGGADYTNSIPYTAIQLPRMTKFRRP